MWRWCRSSSCSSRRDAPTVTIMADAGDDDEFLHVFAKGKGGRAHPVSRKSGVVDSSSAPVAQPKLLPPQRKINSARRAHEAAVHTLVRRHEHVRELAVSGVAAADQAAQRELPPDPTCRPRAPTRPPPLPEMSLQHAYEAAIALEASLRAPPTPSDAATPGDVLKSWQLLYGVAAVSLTRPGCDAQAAYRAQMTALSRQSVLLEGQGSLRAAIRALEATVELSAKLTRDAPLLKMTAAVLRRAAALHAAVGGIDHARRCLTTAAAMEYEVVHGVRPDAPSSDAAAGVEPAVAAVTAVAEAPPVEAEVPDVAPVAPPVEIVQPSLVEVAQPAAVDEAPQPTAPLTLPVYDAADMSAEAVLSRVLVAAMFSNNFDPLVSLLNKALLGDSKATDALKSSLQPLNVTPLMVAASADRADVVRRIIASLPRSSVISHVLTLRDVSGHNAIAHAIVRSAVRALDELLRAVNNAGFGLPPLPTSEPASPAAAFSHACAALGVPATAQSSMSASVEDQMRMFTMDAAAYVRDFRPPVLAAALTPPPAPVYTPPPLPSGPPPYAMMPPALTYALHSMAWAQAAALMTALSQASAPPPLPTGPAPVRAAASAAAAPPPAPAAASSRGGAATATRGRGAAAASGMGRKAPLQPYVAPVDASVSHIVDTPLDAEAASRAAARAPGWDQFDENKRLFGVTASFPAEKYTSRLDMASFTPEQVAAADAIAAAIAGDDRVANAHVREERQQGRSVAAASAATPAGGEAARVEDDDEGKFSTVARRAGTSAGAAAATDTFTDAGIARGGRRGRGGGRGRGAGAAAPAMSK